MRQPHWKSYKNAETVEFFQLFLNITATYDLSSLLLEKEITPLSPLFIELEETFRHSRKSKYTAILVELNKDRNNGLKAFKKAIEFNLLHYKTERVSAATNILAILNQYGTQVHELKYSIKTATIRGLSNTLLKNVSLLEDLKTLDLYDLLSYIQEKNKAFERTFFDRNLEQSKTRNKSFNKIKTDLITYYRIFIKTLEAHAFLNDTGKYTDLIQEIHNLVVKFQTTTSSSSKLKSSSCIVPPQNYKKDLVHQRSLISDGKTKSTTSSPLLFSVKMKDSASLPILISSPVPSFISSQTHNHGISFNNEKGMLKSFERDDCKEIKESKSPEW